jgi:Amt family ammonium transporter
LRAVTSPRLTPEEEYEGADLSIHKIGPTPEREANWWHEPRAWRH